MASGLQSLIDVFGRLLLEDGGKQFVTDATAAGGKAGAAAGKAASQAASQSLGSALRSTAVQVGGRLLATGVGGALGIATKGALEMQNAVADFQAATGASLEEAQRVVSSSNAIAGRQRQSLESVVAVAEKVSRDLGATGDQADALTESFVKFGRVTKQDAVGATTAFDDILDAWGLTAADASTIMDKLVVSGQKYGGVITEDQQALAELAPALKAANLNVDDGIGLLNLFKASGVDVGAAVTGMSKALATIKSPQQLQKLIDDISNTTDPLLRAQKAATLFGAKAGPKLASALAGNHLADFKETTDETTGALNKAGDALDSTFSAQAQRLISQTGAALRQFGADFGPAVTGAASLASLGGALGLDRLVAKAAGPAVKAGRNLGRTLATNVAAGLAANSSVVGDGLSKLLSKVPGAGAAKGAAAALSSALNGAFEAAAAKAGISGAAAGTAFSIAASAAIVALPVAVTYVFVQDENKRRAEQQKQLSDAVQQLVTDGTTEGLQKAQAQLQKQLAFEKASESGVSGFVRGLFGGQGQTAQVQADLDAVTKALADRAAGIGPAVADGVEAGAPAVGAAVDSMTKEQFDALLGKGPKSAKSKAKAAGEVTVQSYADGIMAKQAVVGDAISALEDLMKNALGRGGKAARDIGFLTGEELSKGLNDGRASVRHAAELAQQTALDELQHLVESGQPLGKKAMDALNAGLKSKNAQTRKAAQAVQALINQNISPAVQKAHKYGQQVDTSLASGIRAKQGVPSTAAANLAKKIIAQLRLAVIRAALTSLGLGGGGGGNQRAGGGPVKRDVPYVIGEKGWEVFVPKTDGTVVSHEDAARQVSGGTPLAPSGGDTYQLNFPMTGVIRAESPSEVAHRVQSLAASGIISSRRQREKVTVRSR